ncbi:sugar transferase [Thermoclostridium stercorarium subsp. leptospartum DSM 9219]|uniref:Sugar transferase n=1 Tax=Thermoclostridium stercorarium subsp. leptospartum DSM 9219 TaxID=1346611 RepID=A0A1B1YHG1_THEST|nr:sugar transferase [Thermoclostridium stercorarium]ANX00204.1 sugar transferase [Thermoclostridium stercorarium subsp. leptospartum DSM 9219]
MRDIELCIKRIFDVVSSIIGIILTLPLMIIIAILIKVTSAGPVFFTQDRLGKNGKAFKIIKFRTMIVNAEKEGDGLFINSENDYRITKIGRFLRATSLDELPQLFNVLKGDMSLVGPRPPVTYHPYKYADYSNEQKKRFEMRPGITGLAQVTVRNSVPWDERIRIDVEYVQKFSIWLDFKILLMTFLKILKRENIYYKPNNEYMH